MSGFCSINVGLLAQSLEFRRLLPHRSLATFDAARFENSEFGKRRGRTSPRAAARGASPVKINPAVHAMKAVTATDRPANETPSVTGLANLAATERAGPRDARYFW
jgi:hypothetical protein